MLTRAVACACAPAREICEGIDVMHSRFRRAARASTSDVCFSLFDEFGSYNKRGLSLAAQTATPDFAQTALVDAGAPGVLAGIAGRFRTMLLVCKLDTILRIADWPIGGKTTR